MLPNDLIISIITILTLVFEKVEAHGRLIDPPSRASMWRYGFNLPQSDYDDNQGYCGGQQQLWNRFNGVCGVCGDARSPMPRAHERGGKYYAGTVVKTYREGDIIEVTTQITANHKGWYEFRLCAYDNPKNDDLELDNNGNFLEVSHECLNKHLLETEGGNTRWYMPSPYKVGLYNVRVKLPDGLSCHNCLFQWKWNVANSWGSNPDGKSCIGCGEQEQFYACSDISIEPRSGKGPPVVWSPPRIPPRNPPQQPVPEVPKFKPQTPRHKPNRPRPKPNTPKPDKHRPAFTYTPMFPTPIPPHFIPIRPKPQNPRYYPSWIPALSTKLPSWHTWFNPRRTEVKQQQGKQGSSSEAASKSDIGTPTFETRTPTISQVPKNSHNPTDKPSTFKFWNWLSDRFSPKSKSAEESIPTTAPPDAPWWLKLPSSKRVVQWWNIISKFNHKFKVTTTAMPLPWWVNKSKLSEDLLPTILNEKDKNVADGKFVNSISAAASKDAPATAVLQQAPTSSISKPVPVQAVTKPRKRRCRPVGRLIQFPNMWLWCDTNCSTRHCPSTHCICSS